jgi:hypothetical protein
MTDDTKRSLSAPPSIESLLKRKAKLEADLHVALTKCATRYGIDAEKAFTVLTDLPKLLLSPVAPVTDVMQGVIKPDVKAMLLRTQQKRWGEIEGARWGDLSKAEKRSSNKLAGFLGSGRTFIKQRPAQIDYGLAIFLIFTLEKLLGCPKIPISRSWRGGPPHGPAFKALLISLNLAQCRAAMRNAVALSLPADVAPRALEEIVRATNRPTFNVDRNPDHVASNVHTLIHDLGMSRRRVKR